MMHGIGDNNETKAFDYYVRAAQKEPLLEMNVGYCY